MTEMMIAYKLLITYWRIVLQVFGNDDDDGDVNDDIKCQQHARGNFKSENSADYICTYIKTHQHTSVYIEYQCKGYHTTCY